MKLPLLFLAVMCVAGCRSEYEYSKLEIENKYLKEFLNNCTLERNWCQGEKELHNPFHDLGGAAPMPPAGEILK